MECLSHMHLCGDIMLLEVGTCKTLLKHQWKQKSWAAKLVTGKPITAVNPVWFSCKEKTKQETSRWSLTLVQISLLGSCNLIWWCCLYQQQTQKNTLLEFCVWKAKAFFSRHGISSLFQVPFEQPVPPQLQQSQINELCLPLLQFVTWISRSQDSFRQLTDTHTHPSPPNRSGQLRQQMSSSTSVYCMTFYSCHKMAHPPPPGLMQAFSLASGAGRLLAWVARSSAIVLDQSVT